MLVTLKIIRLFCYAFDSVSFISQRLYDWLIQQEMISFRTRELCKQAKSIYFKSFKTLLEDLSQLCFVNRWDSVIKVKMSSYAYGTKVKNVR